MTSSAPENGAYRAGIVTHAYVSDRAKRFVGEQRSVPHAPRALLIRAQPVWNGPSPLSIDGAVVHIRPGISQFAILDAFLDLPEDELLVVLTDRTEQDLGDAVLLRAHGGKVEALDEWDAVPALFAARKYDRELRTYGSWVPGVLLDRQPTGGWPPATSGVVTVDHAFSNLVQHILGLRLDSELDAVMLLEAVNTPRARAAWWAVPTELREKLIQWAERSLGAVAAFALRTAGSAHTVSTIAIGIAIDVLWPESLTHAQQGSRDLGAAQGRLERFIGGRALSTSQAREIATAATAVVLRMAHTESSERTNVLQQAEAFLVSDLLWPEGPAGSRLLHGGLSSRLRALAALLSRDDSSPSDIEAALKHALAHELARTGTPDVQAARMAVRLTRWLREPEPTAPASLSDALLAQARTGAWVDRAAAAVWDGSSDPQIADTYRQLLDRVRLRREHYDALAASLLLAQVSSGEPLAGCVPVEDLLARVVLPASAHRRTLLIVIDGMSARVATQVAEDAALRGWVEWVPADSERRTAALAALPSMTTFSRTSLFSGALLAGVAADEKRTFNTTARGTVFHKADLESGPGEKLPTRLTAAISSSETALLGVVLNTVDDALGKQDPGGTTWTLDAIRYLIPLLDAARLAKRTVILVSDHGHVIERGSEHRPVTGADARWRPTSTGPVGDGEVLISGPRVLAPGNAAILAWREDLRYGNKQAGYHGGASLSEITIPVIVLNPVGEQGAAGWVSAPPQSPLWWNDPALAAVEPLTGRRSRVALGNSAADYALPAPARSRYQAPENQGTLAFAVPEPVTAPRPEDRTDTIVDALLHSSAYRGQRVRAGRRALSDDTVRTLLTALVERGGRAHQDTLAQAAGIPSASIDTTLAALRRLLNIDSYGVVSQDADRVTIVLDETLLREQFELTTR